MERTKEMEMLQHKVYCENLMYYFKSSSKDVNFTDAETLFNDKKSKRLRFEDVEFKSKLSSI